MNENRTAFEVSVELSLHGIEERLDKLERIPSTTGGPTPTPKEPEKVWPQIGSQVFYSTGIAVESFLFDDGSSHHLAVVATGRGAPTPDLAEANHAWLTSPEAKAHREAYMSRVASDAE